MTKSSDELNLDVGPAGDPVLVSEEPRRAVTVRLGDREVEFDPMNRLHIEKRAAQEVRVEDAYMLGASSASTVFGYARTRGWITEEQYEEAARRSGRLWNYCGD